MIIKLFAVDLDGTLLNKEGKISEENKVAIRLAADNGIRVVIATGRSMPTMSRFREELGLLSESDYAITLNGGCILRENTAIKEHRLAKDDAFAVLSEVRAIPSVRNYIRVYFSANLSAIEHENEYTEFYHKHTGRGALLVPRLEDKITEGVFKVLVFQEESVINEAAEILRLRKPDNVNMFFSSKNLLEFTAQEATKGNALGYLADELGLSHLEVAAMGDSGNDLSMLEFAGLSIAPQNAEPAIKKAANFITTATNSENAVAEAIHIILKL